MFYLKGVPYEVIEEPLRVWTPWMRTWSETYMERARVPVLQYVLEPGVETVMAESNEINLFLDAYNGVTEYTPPAGSEAYQEMEDWWRWCQEVFKPAIDVYKYGENLQYDPEKNAEHEAALHTTFGTLESVLVDTPCLQGEQMTLADVAIIPFVRQVLRTRGGVFPTDRYPKVLAWTKTIIETAWFQNEVMQKFPLASSEK